MIPRLPPPTRNPDLVIDGHPIHFVWRHPTVVWAWKNRDGSMSAKVDQDTVPAIPRGMLIHHRDAPGANPNCVLWLPWTEDPEEPGRTRWTLLSLHPLSLAEPFACHRCGMVGAIRDGQWWWWHEGTGKLVEKWGER